MSFLYDPPILQPSATSSGAALERALREQQTLLDSAGAGIVFIRQRLVVRANPRYAEIFGYASHHDLVGQTSESFYPNRNAFRALGRAAYPVVSQGKTYRTEQLIRISRSIQSLPASLVCSNSRLDPVEVGQLAQALWILAQAYPGIAQRLIEFLQISIDPIAQVALAQLAPQQFGRVELGRIRRQV